jgi:hypothetical protein
VLDDDSTSDNEDKITKNEDSGSEETESTKSKETKIEININHDGTKEVVKSDEPK